MQYTSSSRSALLMGSGRAGGPRWKALGLIASAKRPVVLAGRGAVAAGAEGSLAELAELIGAPLTTSVLAKDMFAGHPGNLGMCGNLAHSAASAVLAEADCIVAVGASLNLYPTTRGELTSGKKIVQIDSDPGRFGWYVRPDEDRTPAPTSTACHHGSRP